MFSNVLQSPRLQMEHIVLDKKTAAIVFLAFFAGIAVAEIVLPSAWRYAYDSGFKAGVTHERIDNHNREAWCFDGPGRDKPNRMNLLSPH